MPLALNQAAAVEGVRRRAAEAAALPGAAAVGPRATQPGLAGPRRAEVEQPDWAVAAAPVRPRHQARSLQGRRPRQASTTR